MPYSQSATNPQTGERLVLLAETTMRQAISRIPGADGAPVPVPPPPVEPAPTTAAGIVGAATRGLALPAAGAAAGAALGAPLAGVGAIPGAAAGAGAAALAQFVGDPLVGLVNRTLGTQFTAPTQAMEALLTRIGVAQPRTEAERIVQATTAGAAGAGGVTALGRSLQAAAGHAAPVTREVGRMLAAQPVAQVAGGAGAGAAGQVAQEAGAGAAGQLAASLAGGVAGGTAAVLPGAVRSARQQRLAQPAQQPAPTVEISVPGAPTPAPQPAAAAAAATAGLDEAFADIGTLARKAAGSGPGSTTARAKLAELAQVNPEARAQAQRLGFDLPFDVLSDNPQIRAAVGLTRSIAGSEAEAAWVNTVRNAVQRADEVMQQFDAAFVEGRPAPGAVSQSILASLKARRSDLSNQADAIYNRINGTPSAPGLVARTDAAQLTNTQRLIQQITQEVGKAGMTSQERRLAAAISGEQGPVTYGRLIREKQLIGQAMQGKESPYGNVDAATLKRLYGALAQDQLDTVGAIAGEEARRELRAANLLVAQRKGLEDRIVGAFGKESDGSVATLMQSAIRSASRGDAAQFQKLLKVVPKELQRETVATALASVSSANRAGMEGAFGFAEFAKAYRGLRANPPVYKQIVGTLGKGSDAALRDLYEISKRITDARAQVLTTGKANQALVESMRAEGLVGKVMQSTMTQRAVGAAAGMGGPIAGAVMPDVVRFMSGSGNSINAAGKLFASDAFQRLVTDAATKPQVSESLMMRVANSKEMRDFARAAKIPATRGALYGWLQSALQSVGAEERQAQTSD